MTPMITGDIGMNDLVSRQAALDAFGLSEKTRKYGGDHSGYDTRLLYEIQNILKGLPPAQQEPKTAKILPMIIDGEKVNNCWKCSNCYHKIEWQESKLENLKYCWNCGANFKGENDG